MPITILDPHTALIVVDMQKGIAAIATDPPIHDVIGNCTRLATTFRHHDLPVVLVNAEGGAPGRTDQPSRLRERPPGWTDILPEMDQQLQDHTVTKRTWGSFTNTDLESYLRDRRITQVVLSGVATSAGVESTARQAHELGFNVTLATDAMTDLSPEAHSNSITRIFPRLGEVGSTSDIIHCLDSRSTR